MRFSLRSEWVWFAEMPGGGGGGGGGGGVTCCKFNNPICGQMQRSTDLDLCMVNNFNHLIGTARV